MTILKHIQANLHDPENDVYGDCWRAVVACLLRLPLEEVPHVCDGPDDGEASNRMRAFLESRNCALIQVPFTGEMSLEQVLDYVGSTAVSGGLHYCLMGTSRTGVNHVVICKDDAIVHDTSRTQSGIVGPASDGLWWVEWVVRRAACDAIGAALSTDAEPVAWYWQKSGGVHLALNQPDVKELAEIVGYSPQPLYAEPVKTAPAVAVKALEWELRAYNSGKHKQYIARSIVGNYAITDLSVLGWFEWLNRSCGPVGKAGTLEESKAAAQADYDARIRSALSAQVQDVAGWQSMDSAPTDGSEFVAGRRYAPDGEFVVHTYKWVGEPNYWSSKRNGVCIRPQYQDDFVWCPLPASPASKPEEPAP